MILPRVRWAGQAENVALVMFQPHLHSYSVMHDRSGCV